MLFPILLILGGAFIFFTVSKWALKAAGVVSGWAAKAAKLGFKVVFVIFIIYVIGVGAGKMIGM